jgi:hypothetical protein
VCFSAAVDSGAAHKHGIAAKSSSRRRFTSVSVAARIGLKFRAAAK